MPTDTPWDFKFVQLYFIILQLGGNWVRDNRRAPSSGVNWREKSQTVEFKVVINCTQFSVTCHMSRVASAHVGTSKHINFATDLPQTSDLDSTASAKQPLLATGTTVFLLVCKSVQAVQTHQCCTRLLQDMYI